MDSFSTPGDGMAREIKARVSHGKIELPEDIELPEGEEVTILVKKKPEEKTTSDGFDRAAGGWVGLVDTDELLRIVQEGRKVISPPVEL